MYLKTKILVSNLFLDRQLIFPYTGISAAVFTKNTSFFLNTAI